MENGKVKAAILGSGNIGTDLLIKIIRYSKRMECAVFVGIDPDSPGLKRAKSLGIQTSHKGVDGLMALPEWDDVKILFDATSARAHHYNWNKVRSFEDKRMIDLTPAAIGPFLVPAVNFEEHLEQRNLNMVTCGGQATIPIIAAINQIVPVHYGEIVASIASKSAGPGTRANIDEFTQTTAHAIEDVGGAKKGKAIIILNPAEPPLVMRDTIFALSDMADKDSISKSIQQMIGVVQQYVPGYQLHQEIQFEEISSDEPVYIEGLGYCSGLKTTVFLRVEGAGHYLPEYAGNLDIMTSAAMATGERIAELIKL